MAQQIAVPLDQMAQRLFALIDTLDVEGIDALITDDCEEVDEITRAWMRGRAALNGYFNQLRTMIDEIHTDVRDVAAREWADTGVVTCVIDQTYRMQGNTQRITAPTTLVLRRQGGEWRIALVHTVPLADAAAS